MNGTAAVCLCRLSCREHVGPMRNGRELLDLENRLTIYFRSAIMLCSGHVRHDFLKVDLI